MAGEGNGGGKKRLEAAEADQALSWVRGFLADRDKTVEDYQAPFSVAEIVEWSAEHGVGVDVGTPQTETEFATISRVHKDKAGSLITAYIEECIESDLVRRFTPAEASTKGIEWNPGRYVFTETGAELFWDYDHEL